jgi:predicted ATPase
MARPARFVGREGELSRLLGALGGDVRLVLVVGDAGAGKTRFVAEVNRPEIDRGSQPTDGGSHGSTKEVSG